MGAVWTGDTLFRGGPGATGRSYSDFPTIIDSIRSRLLTLPAETVVYTGHGGDTTVGGYFVYFYQGMREPGGKRVLAHTPVIEERTCEGYGADLKPEATP